MIEHGAYAIFNVDDGIIRCVFFGSLRQAERQVFDGENLTQVVPGVGSNTHRIDTASGDAVLLDVQSPTQEDTLDAARTHRDRLLAASDWTQAPDNRLSTEQRAAWAHVREEWRLVVDDLKAGRTVRPWADEPAL